MSETKTPMVSDHAIPGAASHSQQQYAQRLLHWLSSGASYVLGAGVSIVFGLAPLPSSPLVRALQNPIVAIVVAIALVIGLSLLTFYLTRQLGPSWFLNKQVPSRIALFVARTIITTFGGAVIGVILGLGPVSSTSAPVIVLMRTHPPLGIGLIAGLLALIILSPLITGEVSQSDTLSAQSSSRLFTATMISVISSLSFLMLLSLVVIQPSWCPTAVCPVYFDPHGVHDDNLEAVYSTTQSSTFAIPGDPAQYTVSNAPRQMPAVRTDAPFAPYRVVVKVDNRQRSGVYPIIIEKVVLMVDQVSPVPEPLNVWTPGSLLDYRQEPYLASFQGGIPGAKFGAVYQPVPGSYVQLQPGGADELDIQVISATPDILRFHIEILYRVADQAATHTLVLPNTFQVTFSNAANWHPAVVTPQGQLEPGS